MKALLVLLLAGAATPGDGQQSASNRPASAAPAAAQRDLPAGACGNGSLQIAVRASAGSSSSPPARRSTRPWALQLCLTRHAGLATAHLPAGARCDGSLQTA